MPSEDFYRAMRYLRLVCQNLAHAENMSHCCDASSQRVQDTNDNDDETYSFSSLSSTSSSSHSRSSSISDLTTVSDVFLDTSMPQTGPYSDEGEILDLRDSIMYIAQRVTCQRFAEELEHAFRSARFAFATAIGTVLSNCNLSYCEVSQKLHVFEEGRRCHRCDVQLCRVCSSFLLCNCQLLLLSILFAVTTLHSNVRLLRRETSGK
jgi:hypothetical protein